jgi:tryptophan synthase alpha chain
MTNRIDDKFAELRAKRRAAFIAYVTAGDPDDAASVDVVCELARSGADFIELGVPYSDPLADGPVIQDAFSRVLARGFHISETFDMAREIRRRSQVPLLAMVSYSIIFRHGAEKFVDGCVDAGIDGAIVPDLTVEEGGAFLEYALTRDFKTVMLVAPTTEAGRERRIVAASTGFIYCVSVVGITGERKALPADVQDHIARLRKLTDKPICVGFGVSMPEHVRMLAGAADGIIVGSAIVRFIAEHSADRAKLLGELSRFVKDLTAPLRG